MQNIYKRSLMICLGAGLIYLISSCSKDRLKPEPLSFYEPDQTYVDAAAMRAALVSCVRNARIEYYGDNPPILTEMLIF